MNRVIAHIPDWLKDLPHNSLLDTQTISSIYGYKDRLVMAGMIRNYPERFPKPDAVIKNGDAKYSKDRNYWRVSTIIKHVSELINKGAPTDNQGA